MYENNKRLFEETPENELMKYGDMSSPWKQYKVSNARDEVEMKRALKQAEELTRKKEEQKRIDALTAHKAGEFGEGTPKQTTPPATPTPTATTPPPTTEPSFYSQHSGAINTGLATAALGGLGYAAYKRLQKSRAEKKARMLV